MSATSTTPLSVGDLLAGCLAPQTTAALPEPVAQRLGLPDATARGVYLQAATEWLADRPPREYRASGENEVVYQAFLGPFLGFAGETGTLCSLTCHLPFVIEDLRATAILLLPLLRRGTARKKGTTGSPFAVCDHRKLDPAMGGFASPLSTELAWGTLVAECRRIGVRLGMILPLATIAIDARQIAEIPGLVHWWRAEPTETLRGQVVGDAPTDWQVEAIPAADALDRFVAPPAPEAIREVLCDGARLFTATDPAEHAISVANAYPDPVVPDVTTYSWHDVAAIRFTSGVAPVSYRGDHATGDNQVAIDFVREVVTRRLETDGGALLADVSSALPSDVLQACVPPYPQTMLVAEQLWSYDERDPFAFVTGPLIPCVAAHTRAPGVLARSLAYHLNLLGESTDARWFFAGVANHDSVPCPESWTRALLTLFCLLPRSVPFLYSGTEFGCETPTNIEFGELGDSPRPAESDLLLFSQSPVAVGSGELAGFTAFWRDLLTLRAACGTAHDPPRSISAVAHCDLLVSVRLGHLLVVVNCDPQHSRRVTLDDPSAVAVAATAPFEVLQLGIDAGPASTLLIGSAALLDAGASFETALLR